MKFKVLKNVWLGSDRKTGQIKSFQKGEVIEFGPEDIAQIDSLIRDLFITPIDNGLIPDTARYKVLHFFKRDFNGEVVTGNPGSELKLPRDVAINLMAWGYIVPLDENAWYPGKPSHRAEGEVKKMYDDLDAETENQKGFITSWKEVK
jgi:hypothetical protein